MKKGKILLAVIFIFSLTFILLFNSVPASAAGNSKYYCTDMTGNEQGTKKITVKENNLIIWGTFGTGSSPEDAFQKYYEDPGQYKKHVFKLSKKTKFYAVGGDVGKTSYSRKVFKEAYATQPGLGLGLEIAVRKGKVVKINTYS